jgi:hypothetical protein
MDMIGGQETWICKASGRNADAIAKILSGAKELSPAAIGAKPRHLAWITRIREMVSQICPLNCHRSFGKPSRPRQGRSRRSLAFGAGAGMNMARVCCYGDLQCAAFTTGKMTLALRWLVHFTHGIAPAFVYDGRKVAKQAQSDNAS